MSNKYSHLFIPGLLGYVMVYYP